MASLSPTFSPTHLNVEVNYLSWGKLIPEWHLLPCIAQATFWLLGQLEVDLLASSHNNQFQLYYTLELLLTPGALAFNTFNHWGELCISFLNVNSSSVVHICSKSFHNSVQTFYSSGTMWDGGFLASHSSKHVGRCSSLVCHCKGSCHGCFGRSGAQGSAIVAFNPLAAQKHVLFRKQVYGTCADLAKCYNSWRCCILGDIGIDKIMTHSKQ